MTDSSENLIHTLDMAQFSVDEKLEPRVGFRYFGGGQNIGSTKGKYVIGWVVAGAICGPDGVIGLEGRNEGTAPFAYDGGAVNGVFYEVELDAVIESGMRGSVNGILEKGNEPASSEFRFELSMRTQRILAW